MRKRIESLIEEMLNGKILLAEALCEFEKIYIKKAIDRNNGHLSRTADALGIHRNTLSGKLTAYRREEKPAASKPRMRSAVSKKKAPVRKLKARAAGSSR